ncbi:ACT domain-containing protein [Lentilactobacillus sp. Marseille-Q4993]|uniref:ACT domain-containing protein n=1 Tax=Lentilactobacillus sp. Marseille-Q4993 TaxID=3039492 RepID=UPI0024BC15F4|nr:ACT domain-containing protein [Lentilactobacillus sp. Marseille-Q4993]
MEKYFIVDSSILPDSFEKVIQARQLIESGKYKKVSDAVKQVGISRGTFYKYKDLVFLPEENMMDRKAVISLLLENERGVLSKVLMTISDCDASVLTINQNIPIHNVASLVLSLDISHIQATIDELTSHIKEIPGASNVALISIE